VGGVMPMLKNFGPLGAIKNLKNFFERKTAKNVSFLAEL